MLCATPPEILSPTTNIGLEWQFLLKNNKVRWNTASHWSVLNTYKHFIEIPTSPIYTYPFCLNLMSHGHNGCIKGDQPLIIKLQFDKAPSDGMIDLVLCLEDEAEESDESELA
jgi:hypothetical protein